MTNRLTMDDCEIIYNLLKRISLIDIISIEIDPHRCHPISSISDTTYRISILIRGLYDVNSSSLITYLGLDNPNKFECFHYDYIVNIDGYMLSLYPGKL